MEKAKSIKKIDIHAHATAFPEFTPPNPKGERYISAEELIGQYDLLGIGTGVLLPLVNAESMLTTITSEACKAMADRYPDRFVWFCNVDPRAAGNHAQSNLTSLLEWYKSLGAKGCGEITANLYADDPKLDNLFSACEELDMPALIHIGPILGRSYGIVDELGLPRIESMLKKHPKLKLIGHSQCFWCEISADVTVENRTKYPEGKVTEGRVAKLMRDYENLYCDLSAGSGTAAFMRDPDYTAKFVDEFSDRIMYGCDQFYLSNKNSFQFNAFLDQMLDDGMMSAENYAKIARYNAANLLNIK